jgi:TolB-like protein/class 3 adenylate cyclase/tetratricopeptide (TPR) repeat protein
VPEGFKRKLTAILNADVEGYSRLMRENEETTIRTLTTYRGAMATLIQKFRGRVVDAPGDNLLAEFASVVDAVQCAVEIQRELAERNAELPAEHKMAFRIGVNLGDVVEEDSRIYGDGVNIAARLESICEGGGICISGTAFEHIEHKLDLEFEDLGEHEVKNITKPVRVYRVLSYPGAAAHRVVKAKRALQRKWRKAALVLAALLVIGVGTLAIWNFFLRPAPPTVEPASIDRMAFPLPDKPSIAVLPFTNLSEDPEQEFLSDGITENIITSLSRVPDLFVIARNSTFTYKGKPVKVQQVAEELGVRYVLEGSMQRSGDRVRINVQLIDALAGSHLWAKRYDREIKDVFALQDEISLKVAGALDVELVFGHAAKQKLTTDNLEAFLTLMRGRAIHYRHSKDDNFQSIQLYKKAIELDPEWIYAKIMLGWAYWLDGRYGWNYSRQESFRQAGELAQEALAAEPSNPFVYSLLGALHLFPKREYDKAIEFGEKSVVMDPNDANAKALLAYSLVHAGRPQEAIVLLKKAMRLTPYYPNWYLNVLGLAYHLTLGLAYHLTGEYEKAVEVLKSSVERNPDSPLSQVRLAMVYAGMDRMEEARATAAEVLRINPKFTVSNWAKVQLFKDPAVHEHQEELMRKAGLPE